MKKNETKLTKEMLVFEKNDVGRSCSDCPFQQDSVLTCNKQHVNHALWKELEKEFKSKQIFCDEYVIKLK